MQRLLAILAIATVLLAGLPPIAIGGEDGGCGTDCCCAPAAGCEDDAATARYTAGCGCCDTTPQEAALTRSCPPMQPTAGDAHGARTGPAAVASETRASAPRGRMPAPVTPPPRSA